MRSELTGGVGGTVKPVLYFIQRMDENFQRLYTEQDAMKFENIYIEPTRDVLKCMATDKKILEQVVDRAVKLQLLVAREAHKRLESWRFERNVLGITD
jgi:hypothetical protein